MGAGGIAATTGVYRMLLAQARTARTVIPRTTADFPPNGDGVYTAGCDEPVRVTLGTPYDLHLAILGDSTAAGLGTAHAEELPGVLLARAVAESTRLRVRLSTKAIAGATSKGLDGQVDAMLVAGQIPQVAVILIGGNDVTARNGLGPSARRLGDAVRRLGDVGASVVSGTCPDLGAIRPIGQPLRSVLGHMSQSLARMQEAEIRRAGGRAVPLSDSLAADFLADPERMFAADRFHPSAAGYEMIAGLLTPAVLEELRRDFLEPGPVENASGPFTDAAEPPADVDRRRPTLVRLTRRLDDFRHRARRDGRDAREREPRSARDAVLAADTLRDEGTGPGDVVGSGFAARRTR